MDCCDVTVTGREVICFSTSLNGFKLSFLLTGTNGMGCIGTFSFPSPISLQALWPEP